MRASVMGRYWIVVAAIALTWAAGATAAERLTHRAWLLGDVPGAATLDALRDGGIDALVLPVGEVAVGKDDCRLRLTPLPELAGLEEWTVIPLVWAAGEGDATGSADTLLNELAPVVRLLGGATRLALAVRSEWPGVVDFAEAVGERAGHPVELVLPARSSADLAGHLPKSVHLTVVALGNSPALGFPALPPGDDLAALEAVDATGVGYRVALVVAPVASPAPQSQGASLASLASPTVAEFRPAERGDDFVLRQPLDWGGNRLTARSVVHVEVVDSARYHRDLGLVLRPIRPGLEGWDTVGVPGHEPALGMSLEAFLDYLHGGQPFPAPQVQAEWPTPTRLRVALANPNPHTSALASTGNFVELHFEGTQLLELGLGDFAGAEYGRIEGGVWRRAVAREANGLRLYVTYVPPSSRFGGVAVTFFSRPQSVTARWVMRLGDGREVEGEATEVPVRRP